MSKDNTQHGLVPRLRFPEFRDAGPWTAKALGEYCDRLTEKVGDAELTPVSISAGTGFVSQKEKFGRDISGAQYSRYIRMQKGDFAYNRGNSKRFPQGCVYQLTEFDEAAASNAFHCFRLHPEHEPSFFEGLFESNWHGRQLIRDITSSARSDGLLNIKADTFFDIKIPMPPNTAEQRKIAECLGSLDDLITAEGLKLEALEDHKKGLMQQLFPHEGETQPRLRFPEFRNAPNWEPRTIDELASLQSGGTPSKSNTDYWGGSVPWVSAKDMKRVYLDDTEDHLTEAAIEDGAKLVPAGTVLMLTRGMTLLKDVPICLLQRSMTFNQDVKALRAQEGIVAEFFTYLLIASKPALRALVDIAGHGTGRLNTDDLKRLALSTPKPAEQQRIANCISALDTQISAQAEKLDALRTHKRGLMQQLFPSPEAASR